MNIHEGARRMRRAGLALIPLSAITAYLGMWMEAGRGIEILFLIAGPGFVLWLFGWIVEGFAQDVH